MPFTNDFIKIKKHYERLYPDKAKALTFAFRDAFGLKVQTFENTRVTFKRINKL